MNDLFHTSEKSEKSGMKSEKVRSKISGLLPPLLVEREVRKHRTFPFPKVGKVRWTSLSTSGVEGRPKSELRDEANRLRFEIEKVEAIRAAADRQQSPYQDAFYAATDAVLGVQSIKRSGHPISKKQITNAYDVRVAAGHAWHPYRARLKEAERWLKALRMELTNINKEIG